MSSNTLGNTDFNAVNGAVPPPKGKATLQKDNKLKLAETPPDKFERTATPRKVGEEAETTATTVAEPKKDLLPILLGAFGAVAGVSALAVALFKKPAEAASTAEKLVDEVARKQIETLEKTVAIQTQELAGVKKGIQQTLDDAVNTATLGIKATLATHESNLDDFRTDTETVIASLQGSVSDIQKTVDRTNKQIVIQQKRLDATIPVIGNNVVVDPSVKGYFVVDGRNNLAATLDKPEALDNSVTQLTDYIRKVAVPNDGFENIEFGSLIHQLFDYLKETQSTTGNTTYSLIHKMSHILDEVPRGGYNIFTIDPTKKLPKADYIPALMDTLEYVQNVYNGVPTDENIFKLTSSAFISEKELKQKINAVLDAAAKENSGSKEKVNQAQADLMTWLEDTFTKTKPEIFEMNTNGKSPLKTLPAPHPSSDLVGRDKFFEGDKPLAELTQTLLGKGFKGGEGAENPYTLTDVAILSDAIGALQRALMKEQGYTLENGVLQVPRDSSRSELARTVNLIAKTLIPITPEAIEGGRVPLRVVEVDSKKPYPPDEMWNARLNGDAEEVKTVTAKMFDQLRQELITVFFEDNKLVFPDRNTYATGVDDSLSGGYLSDIQHLKAYNTIQQRTALADGADFTQTVANQIFEGFEKSKFEDDSRKLMAMYTHAENCILSAPVDNSNVKNWQQSLFPKVLEYAAWHSNQPWEKLMFEDTQQALATWEHFPELKEKVQATISARTESVEAVKARQTELMAFLKEHFYEKPTSS